MRKLNASLFISLDGVTEAPGGEPTLPEDRRGWSMPFTDEAVGGVIWAGMDSYDAMLLGRKTYEDFAAYWPHAPQDDPFSAIMNGRTKYVVSTTLERADWTNSHLLKGDWAAQVADLKQQPGKNISVVGSGTLVRSLLRHRLLDELQLMVCPVILGVGARLYDGIDFMQTTKVIESQSFSTGMTFLRLQPL